MELAPTTAQIPAVPGWTVAVPWARPWYRAAPYRRARTAAGAAEKAAKPASPAIEDDWPEVMRRHGIFLEARREQASREAWAGPYYR